MRVKAKLKEGKVAVKLLAKHPMHTGRMKNPETGEIIPANYITTLSCHVGDKKVFQANFGTGVSKDPFLKFTLINRTAGEILKFKWNDLSGASEQKEVTL